MSPQIIFGTSVAFGLIAWSIVVVRYVWPLLHGQSRTDALRPLLMLHSFRFVGLAFLVTGIVSPGLSAEWARHAAYGDLIAAVLALLALGALPSRSESPWCGSSAFGAARICSTPSIWAIASGSSRVNWGRPTLS